LDRRAKRSRAPLVSDFLRSSAQDTATLLFLDQDDSGEVLAFPSGFQLERGVALKGKLIGSAVGIADAA